MAPQNINQFRQTPVVGDLDLEFQGSVVSARISADQVTAIVPGQALKIQNSGGSGVPNLLATAADTDIPWAVAMRNIKNATFPALAMLEVAREGSVMFMTAGAAIARGAPVEISSTTFKVITAAGINPVIGEAYDQASADGDVIRVWIHTPNANVSQAVKVVDVISTLAEINAGKTLIPALAGASIRVLNYTARVTGAFATGTSVALQSSNGVPVVVTTIAEAGLTNGAVLGPASANTTLGAGFALPLGVGDGLRVVNNGSAQTGGTNIEWTITYKQA